jgi:hypothetical protein
MSLGPHFAYLFTLVLFLATFVFLLHNLHKSTSQQLSFRITDLRHNLHQQNMQCHWCLLLFGILFGLKQSRGISSVIKTNLEISSLPHPTPRCESLSPWPSSPLDGPSLAVKANRFWWHLDT